MHPWHDIEVHESSVIDRVPVVIEVPMGGRNKYEIDKATGFLRLDRVLYGALYYPANYGFVPQTSVADGDPLDVLVFGQEAVYPLTVVDVRVVGAIHMRDEEMMDDKLLAVNSGDPAFSDCQEFSDLPKHILRETVRFFEDYKRLEGKNVQVGEAVGRAAGIDVLRRALRAYREHRDRSRPSR